MRPRHKAAEYRRGSGRQEHDHGRFNEAAA